jgi:cyclohexyl-isocyanide hydratase
MRCGFLLFPGLTQLDLTGPYEILSRAPGFEALLVAKTLDPVEAQWGMRILPDIAFSDALPLDILVIPGGFGVNPAMADDETLSFVQAATKEARYVVSVCTGALLIGAAGLLRGRKATTHWAYHDLLEQFGATPVQARTVRDGNMFSGGGVTAGIDVALRVIGEVCGIDAAKRVQLAVEYDPEPPYGAISPVYGRQALEAATKVYGDAIERTRETVAAAQARLR